VTQARQRLEMQRNLHGEDHPDYATGLNHLALLLIMHDAPDEAEPLLHQALAIRKLALGEDHPDYATCLSSLGGLLWARGDLEAAEPLLHQAHDIRCRVLGADHPRSLASQSCLEQFLRMKSEQQGHGQPTEMVVAAAPNEAPMAVQPPTATPEPVEAFSSPPLDAHRHEAEPELEVESRSEWASSDDSLDLVHSEEVETEPETEFAAEEHGQSVRDDARSHSMSLSMSSNDLSHELVVLTDVFADLSERLIEAAHHLQTPGLPPSDALVAELSSCRREFTNLRDRTLTLGHSLEVDCPTVENLASLEDLTTLLNEIAETELRQSRSEEMRRRSLSVLDRVLVLRHAVDGEFSPLHACQETARTLHGAIANVPWRALPAEAEPLAEGGHAMTHLLTLVEDGDELSDDVWAELHESVGAAFGKSLATAAARARLVLPLEHVGAGSEH
jgi:hypothetical protein